VSKAEAARNKLLESAEVRGLQAAAEFVKLPGPSCDVQNGLGIDESFLKYEKDIIKELKKRFLSNATDIGVALDMKMSGALHPLSSEIVKACLPDGQVRPFRHNMMA